MKPSVVMLSPEPPYPLRGGGAFRIASLLHYFARFADVDLIFLSDSGKPAEIPAGLVRRQTVIPLPLHNRALWARYMRNARRALSGVPPLVDRVSGQDAEVQRALAGQKYDLGLVEHFWAANYVDQLKANCQQVALDLHNVESTLHRRCAETSEGLVAAGHRHFGRRCRALEARLLPEFDLVLTTSAEDRRQVLEIAPEAKAAVYPNAYPYTERTDVPCDPMTVVFSGNFEYHPNIDGVRYLMRDIWPGIAERIPGARLLLVGRGAEFVRQYIQGDATVDVTGPVEDAVAEIARGAVVIAPLRTGSGTRLKILEAWAAHRAVVATPLAAEGLAVESGKNLELRDDPAEFTATVCDLLKNPARRKQLADGGLRCLKERYTWEAAWVTLDTMPQVTRIRQLSSYTGESDALCRRCPRDRPEFDRQRDLHP